MALEENGFLEYLQLQGGEPDLVTKSELLEEVRSRGYSTSERQLTFYMSEGIIPKSVRVGSRAGAYPQIVVQLLAWVLRARDGGLTVDAIRELLPIWKFLIRAKQAHRLELGELEYIARQKVNSIEASIAIPALVTDVLTTCMDCMGCTPPDVIVVMKDGSEQDLADLNTTLGFAIARRMETVDEEGDVKDVQTTWFARTRITLAAGAEADLRTDPTTVILGVGPNEALPDDSGEIGSSRRAQEAKDGVVGSTKSPALAAAVTQEVATIRRKDGNMSKANDRDVVPDGNGGWKVEKPGASRASSRHETQADAINRGREIVGNAGGGELRIHGRDGRIRDSDTIPPGNDPYPPKDRK